MITKTPRGEILHGAPDRGRIEIVLISSTKATTKKYETRDVDELKLISDDKNYDEMYGAPLLTRWERTIIFLRTTGYSKYIL